MYYKEEFINGKWFWKSSPNGEWVEFSKQQYIEKCIELQSELKNNTKADYFEKYQYEANFNQELEYKLFELQKQIKDNFVLSALKDKYSKEDVIDLLVRYRLHVWKYGAAINDLDKWIKQNLK